MSLVGHGAPFLPGGPLLAQLDAKALEELKASHPAIATSLVSNLAREVSGRLRRAARTIRHLAS